ncbi:hypothetical protein [Alkalibacterium gilvum]|uniref:hypothetical protein n=1 Tax=Alkalibacterium gilvum TaxID=1130080 RepID=UPI003F91B842
MIFKSKDFYVNTLEHKDIIEALEVYNSNDHFLINHMDINRVTSEWMVREVENMRDIGFQSCKIIRWLSR